MTSTDSSARLWSRRVVTALVAATTATGALLAAGVASAAGQERAYEMVSPPDKNGIPLHLIGTVQGAPSGDAVVLPAMGSFSGTEQASLFGMSYLARRTGEGWSVESVESPQQNIAGVITYPTLHFSESLERAVQFTSAAFAPGAFLGGSNIFELDTITGARSLVTADPELTMMRMYADVNSGHQPFVASDDLSNFAFSSDSPLLPEAPVGTSQVYEVVDGQVRLASRLPDGSVSADGAALVGTPETSLQHVDRRMSRDGRRIFFNSPGSTSGALYMRVDGTTTAPISVSHRTGDDPTVPVAAKFLAASDDGTVVYFAAGAPLTDDVPSDAGTSLYRFDTETNTLTYVVSSPAGPGRVYGTSPDGSSLFFHLNLGSTSTRQLIHYSLAGGVRAIATTASESGGPNTARMSDNGRYLAWASYSLQPGFDSIDPDCVRLRDWLTPIAGRCTEVYVYDSVANETRCATCADQNGGNRHSSLYPQFKQISHYAPRAVLNDGTVFFTSEEALVAEDVNGRRDVYQWRDGVNALISTGRDPRDSYFGEASADGRDVFFMTRERLVATDVDEELDLYDARVGGGIEAQNRRPADARPCRGDSCQGELVGPPGKPAVGSAGLVARGDFDALRPGVLQASLVRGSVGARSFAISVRVPSRGRISISGTAVRKAGRSVPAARAYRLRIELTARANRMLAKRGRLRVATRVRFTPRSGRSANSVVAVTLRSSESRRGDR